MGLLPKQEDYCPLSACCSSVEKQWTELQAAKRAQQEKDQVLSTEQKKKRLNKEIQAQVKQLIDMNRIAQSDGDIKYNFTDGTMVKSIYVESLIQSQLAKGILSIARYEETYVIIPTSVAKKIMLRDNDTIIEQNSKVEDQAEEDDPYADFVVPDDLMW